jgi:hypothetical protein
MEQEEIKRFIDEILFHDHTEVEATDTPNEYAVNLGDWLVTFDQLDRMRERLDLVYISGTRPYRLQIVVRPKTETK